MSDIRSNEGDWIGLFPTKEIPAIFRIVSVAAMKVSKANSHELEDRITKRLFREIRMLGEYRTSPFKVHPQFYVIAGSEEEADGQIDIAFAIQNMNTYFAIEAKRLHVTYPSGKWESLVTEYVSGDQGMMCFVTQKYSKGLGSGAMLGYVYDGNVGKAKTAIGKSIIANAAKLQLITPNVSKDIWGIDPSLGIGETVHRIERNQFTIYHMLVAV